MSASNKVITKEQLQKKHHMLQDKYDELVTVHNLNVDALQQTINFLTMQCGILYTAITGTMPEDPLKEISLIAIKEEDKDLAYFRDGLVIYTKTLLGSKNADIAMLAFNKHLSMEGKGGIQKWQ